MRRPIDYHRLPPTARPAPWGWRETAAVLFLLSGPVALALLILLLGGFR